MSDAAIVVGTTLATTLFLLLLSGQIQDTTAWNLIGRSAPLLPALTPGPPELGHPSPSPQSSRAIPSPTSTPNETPDDSSNAPDDTAIQAAIDQKLQDNPELSALNIIATVAAGKVTLVGTVESDELKARVEKLVRSVKGVRQVNVQIVVVTND